MSDPRILRGVFQIANEPPVEECSNNWLKLQEYEVGYPLEEDQKIADYLRGFYRQMSAPPDIALIREYFEKTDDVESVSRLEEIKKSQVFIRTNYLSIVRAEQEAQQTKAFVRACSDAQSIAEHGRSLDKTQQQRNDGKKVLKGVPDAIGYLFERMSGLTQIEAGEKLEGDICDDAEEVLDEYEKTVTSNQFQGRNLFGLEPVDSVCKGHRPGEYWVHCAFPGELKTSLALNYLYNNAYVYGRNIFYAILEMKYANLRMQMYAIHSSHGKFVADWYREDMKAGVPLEQCYLGLDFRQVRDGELDEKGKRRLRLVAQDFKATRKGKPYIWHPDQQVSIEDIRRKSEMFHAKYGCDGIVIDYLALVKPNRRTSDHVANINEVVRDGQIMAGSFARGRGVPLLALFQLNRQGKLRADKADGHYDFASIAYANEVEKAADVITYTYLNDELRKQGKFYMGNIKNRGNPIFERMIGKILWNSKRMKAVKEQLVDMDNERILAANRQISMRAQDMYL
jgi:replicative DNA helicase